MLVELFPPSRETLTKFATKFALQQDDWNDYSFQTFYHLYYNPGTSDGEITLIGGVKILRRGQTKADPILITQGFDKLDSEYCSVGVSLDYYQRLNAIPEEDRRTIVEALRDVVAKPELRTEFSSEEGWTTSLFRENLSWESFLADASALFQGNFEALPDLTESFAFQPAAHSAEITFDFSSPEPPSYIGPYRKLKPSRTRVLLPQRVIVLIGRNGSGKSTLLSRMAHVAFASPQERRGSEIRALGSFKPEAIGFMRIITISYSAFDSFTVPGTLEKDLRQISRDIEKGEGRFVYCGLRDIVSETRDDIENAGDEHEGADTQRQLDLADRRSTTKLKSIDQLGDEFAKLIDRIRTTGKDALLHAAMEPLLADPSFVEFADWGGEGLFGENARETYLALSTGHKIAIHVVASLVAHTTRKALVLFDEPEMHLHPPLAAALMHSVRLVLEECNAFSIVATHSPVLLQETLARHVRVIQRVGDELEVRVPKLETFGENVGVLTYDTFGLTASTTDFHKTLDLLIEGCDSLEEIESLFTPGLSAQARAYVMTRLVAKRAQE